MRIVHLSTFDSGVGAARAAFRLHTGFRTVGAHSRMLVQTKSSDLSCVNGPETPMQKLAARSRPHIESKMMQFYGNSKELFSQSLLPDRITSKVQRLQPDLIHLHWINRGFVRIESLSKFSVPLLWTLHDQWAFTGGCHYSGDCNRYEDSCGKCPHLGSSSENDLSSKTWKRKKHAWKDLQLSIVAPSHWLADCARASSLLGKSSIKVIPNALDTSIYKPVDKLFARELLGLDPGKKYILFGALDALTDSRKGADMLQSALQRLSETLVDRSQYELLVFGSNQPAHILDFGIPARYFGRLHDDVTLTSLYAAADVMVVPSKQEAFGQTAIEAMACGTPVVAFGATGLLDIVEHQATGYLARAFSTEDLTRGIQFVLADSARRQIMGRRARARVEQFFSLQAVLPQYYQAYGGLLGVDTPRTLNLSALNQSTYRKAARKINLEDYLPVSESTFEYKNRHNSRDKHSELN